MGKPILAICFGTQMLNVWRGGSLVQHLRPAGQPPRRARRSPSPTPPPLLRIPCSARSSARPTERPIATPAALPVNSSHHQAIDRPATACGVSARSSEDGVVEAIEGTRPNLQAAALCSASSGTRNAPSRRARRRARSSRLRRARPPRGFRAPFRLPWLEGSCRPPLVRWLVVDY